MKRALTIAGSDSGGGAGIQADLKTFQAFGVYGMSVITAVTAQNTVRVNGVTGISPQYVSLQFESVLSDIGVDGVKTGMLYSAEVIQVLTAKFRDADIDHIVIDPVFLATDGTPLLDQHGVRLLKHELISTSTLITPNIPEAEILSDMTIKSLDDMKAAAPKILEMGCKAVLIKGGHLDDQPVDLLFDGDAMVTFKSPRINTRNTHGTGCTLSAAILSSLIKGCSLRNAVHIAKAYITKALELSLNIGKGRGPLNHAVHVLEMDE